MKYRFKENMWNKFANTDSLNEKIANDLRGHEFYIEQYSTLGHLAVGRDGSRLSNHGLFDFKPDELDEYLEIVETNEQIMIEASVITISTLHDWAINHALTDICVEKVVEMHAIYVK